MKTPDPRNASGAREPTENAYDPYQSDPIVLVPEDDSRGDMPKLTASKGLHYAQQDTTPKENGHEGEGARTTCCGDELPVGARKK